MKTNIMQCISNHLKPLALEVTAVLGLAVAPSALGATISYFGTDTNTQAGWRTTSVIKANDIDGDNAYGTDGWMRAQKGGGNWPAPGVLASPSYATLAWDPDVLQDEDVNVEWMDIDQPLAPAASVADCKAIPGYLYNWQTQTNTDLATITLNSDKSFRLTILTNARNTGKDTGYGIKGPGGLDVLHDFALTDKGHWTQFDITGAAGDVFTIYSKYKASREYDLSVIAFDSAAGPDIIPPEWVSGWPKADTATSTGFTARAEINENGKAYYVVVADGDLAPSAIQVKDGLNNAGTAALKSGSITPLSANTEGTAVVTGLAPSSFFDVYFVAEDNVPNLQTAVSSKIDVTTLAGPFITYVGMDTTTGTAWRSSDVLKPMDAGSDNAYGTDGWLADPGVATTATPVADRLSISKLDASYATLAWISPNHTGNPVEHASMLKYDDPTEPIGPGVVDHLYTWQSWNAPGGDYWTITMTQNKSSFRIAVLMDWSMGASFDSDAIRVRQTTGGGGDSGYNPSPVTSRAGAGYDYSPKWAVFEITGAGAGDVFKISSSIASAGENGVTLFALDSATAPPSGYATWAGANGVTGDPSQDSNNDGVANGVAYFRKDAGLLTNPGIDGTGKVTWPNGGNINSDQYGIQFVVQTSSDLQTWDNVPATGDPKLSNQSGSVSYTLPPGEPKIFVRLKVTPN